MDEQLCNLDERDQSRTCIADLFRDNADIHGAHPHAVVRFGHGHCGQTQRLAQQLLYQCFGDHIVMVYFLRKRCYLFCHVLACLFAQFYLRFGQKYICHTILLTKEFIDYFINIKINPFMQTDFFVGIETAGICMERLRPV